MMPIVVLKTGSKDDWGVGALPRRTYAPSVTPMGYEPSSFP